MALTRERVLKKKIVRKTHKKPGTSPGTLIHVGKRHVESSLFRLMAYGPDKVEERNLSGAGECLAFKDAPGVNWINIDGIHDVEQLRLIGEGFDLHPLVLEDILNTEHRPKMEDFDTYIFMVLKMLHFDEEKNEIEAEQVSLILSSNWVLSFQERPGDVFDGVRERIRGGKGRIRKMGPDYLAYALLDSVVDSYFAILEKIGDKIELLEDELISRPTPSTLNDIHHFKREMILLRKSIWPLRELINALQREETGLIAPTTDIFLRDVYDHCINVVDTVETLRDVISGMLDLYLSSLSNRMNEVMKVLTIMATIFIPLTFIAGVYGMNFENMPELKWPWGYPSVWTIMIFTALGMVRYFRRKHWL